MKYKAIGASLLAGSLALGCRNNPVALAASDDLLNRTGTVLQIGSFGFVIVENAEPKERFAPNNLPESFRMDGARVLFSGKRGEIPPNVRMWGMPLELTSIQPDIR